MGPRLSYGHSMGGHGFRSVSRLFRGQRKSTEARLAFARRTVAKRLGAFGTEWRVDGSLVRGPGATAILVDDRDCAAPGHVDLGFALNVDRDDTPVIWDCAAGLGESEEAALEHTVEMWASSTVPVVLKVLTCSGEYAEHYQVDHPEGFPGWHAIHGPILGWGFGEGPQALQDWTLDNPLLPQLAALQQDLDRPELNGVKLIFGGYGDDDVAEVRVNGRLAAHASAGLRSLGWPRQSDPAFVRAFVLLVHQGQ